MVATIVSLINLHIKLAVLFDQLRYRRAEISTFEDKSELMKRNKKLVQTRRTLHLIYASMLVGFAEVCPLHVGQMDQVTDFWLQCIPIGILQLVYAQRMAKPDVMESLSYAPQNMASCQHCSSLLLYPCVTMQAVHHMVRFKWKARCF